MAYNSSNGNPIGAEDGPRFDAIPPPASDEVKVQAHETSSSTDLKGAEHASGQETAKKDLTQDEAEMKKAMEGLAKKQ